MSVEFSGTYRSNGSVSIVLHVYSFRMGIFLFRTSSVHVFIFEHSFAALSHLLPCSAYDSTFVPLQYMINQAITRVQSQDGGQCSPDHAQCPDVSELTTTCPLM